MSFTATNTTLVGLGLSFDSMTVESSFSSGEESFDSLFSDVTLASSGDGSSPPRSPTEQHNHWQIIHASDSDWDESEPDAGFNYFEPYLGVPEVAEFMPWPTSPAVTTQVAEAGSEPESSSVPATPNDRGYETDTEGTTRAQRRQRRRNARGLHRTQRVHHVVEHIDPIIEELPSFEDIQRRIATHAAPMLEEEDVVEIMIMRTTTTTTTTTTTSFSGLDVDDAETAFVDIELEQDITDCRPHANSIAVPEEYDSDDSDVDRYLYDSDGNVDEAALTSSPSGPVHYAVVHAQPIIEDLPSLEELRARMGLSPSPSPSLSTTAASELETEETQRVHEPVGLGISLGLLPLPVWPSTPEPAHHHNDDGFETIDLADDAPVPAPAHTPCVPAAPALRPHHCADGSPSPIVLASPMPMPCAAFRRFDDEAAMGYAARQPIV